MNTLASYYFAAIHKEDLILSGVFQTLDLHDVIKANRKPELGYTESDFYYLVACHSLDDAERRTRLEILERTQAEYALCSFELAIAKTEFEIVAIVHDLYRMSEIKETIDNLNLKIAKIDELRTMKLVKLSKDEVVHGKSLAIPKLLAIKV